MSVVLRVADLPPKPMLIYDGDCGFCVRRVKRWQKSTGEAVDYLALQASEVARRFPELSQTQLDRSVHLIEPDGSVYLGVEAVFCLLAFKNTFPLWLYATIPGFACCAEFVYRLVARHRQRHCATTTTTSPSRSDA